MSVVAQPVPVSAHTRDTTSTAWSQR
jgi:hypothetical protein